MCETRPDSWRFTRSLTEASNRLNTAFFVAARKVHADDSTNSRNIAETSAPRRVRGTHVVLL